MIKIQSYYADPVSENFIELLDALNIFLSTAESRISNSFFHRNVILNHLIKKGDICKLKQKFLIYVGIFLSDVKYLTKSDYLLG